ncbi:hypothetical protein HMPREF3116_04690 [Aerococcus sp. HMSC10H05]|nr:hypothetical protein HMPREF3116_04690 [Aerococcus sp. HMSC10H05]
MYIQDEVIDKFQIPTLDVLGILLVLLKNGAPVDIQTLQALETFGEKNIFTPILPSKIIDNMAFGLRLPSKLAWLLL